MKYCRPIGCNFCDPAINISPVNSLVTTGSDREIRACGAAGEKDILRTVKFQSMRRISAGAAEISTPNYFGESCVHFKQYCIRRSSLESRLKPRDCGKKIRGSSN